MEKGLENPYQDKPGCYEGSCYRRGYQAAQEKITSLEAVVAIALERLGPAGYKIIQRVAELESEVTRLHDKYDLQLLVKQLSEKDAENKKTITDSLYWQEEASRLKKYRDDLLTENTRLAGLVEESAEGLRKCITWAEMMSHRVKEDRDQINWSYLEIARKVYSKLETKEK